MMLARLLRLLSILVLGAAALTASTSARAERIKDLARSRACARTS